MEEIKNSILTYTTTTSDCQKMKILMDPIEYLQGLGKKENTFNLFGMSLFEIGKKNFEFIKSEEELNMFLQHIQNIFVQAYKNYEDPNKNVPTKLYRSISKKELDYLNKMQNIHTLWSTTNSFDTALGFTVEMEENDPFILEFSIKEKVPFIDVDHDAKTVFEPNEFILVPSFKISNVKLKKPGQRNIFGIYSTDNIPIYTANFKPVNNNSVEDVNMEKMHTLYQGVIKNFFVYRDWIEQYVQEERDDGFFYDSGYRSWARDLKNYINLQQRYVYKCIREERPIDKIMIKK